MSPHTHQVQLPSKSCFPTISRSVLALVPGSKRPEGDEATMTSWERIEPHTSTLSQRIEQAGCVSKDGHLCSLDCCCLACWRKSSPKRIMVASSCGKLKGKRKWELQPSCLWATKKALSHPLSRRCYAVKAGNPVPTQQKDSGYLTTTTALPYPKPEP